MMRTNIEPVAAFIALHQRQLSPRELSSSTIMRAISASSSHFFTSPFPSRRVQTFFSTENARNTAGYEGKNSTFSIFYNDVYDVVLPPNHRFPMKKYRKVRLKVQHLIKEETTKRQDELSGVFRAVFRVSPLATVAELQTTHCHVYIERFLTGNQTPEEQRNVGFPWSPAGVKRALSSVGGTVSAACHVVEMHREHQRLYRRNPEFSGSPSKPYAPVWSAHLAGGTHHAFRDYGEGFCVFSDIAVAANVVLQRYPDIVRNILILDLDVHQGNGNAALFPENRPEVTTVSIHCVANYFSEKQRSDLDVELPAGCNDETYLLTLHHWLKQIRQEMVRTNKSYDLVFYQAGVDILDADRLGKMSVSFEGLKRRNEMVYRFVHDELRAPLVITMGGGYPQPTGSWDPILDAHASVYHQAYTFLRDRRI
jgi:acetoin utilization deacetylase AcuC-like enzyme